MKVKFTSNDSLRLAYMLSDEIFKTLNNDQFPISTFYYYSGFKIEKEILDDGSNRVEYVYELYLDLDKLIMKKKEEQEDRKKNFMPNPANSIDIKRYIVKKLADYFLERNIKTSNIRFINGGGICLLVYDVVSNKFLIPVSEDF